MSAFTTEQIEEHAKTVIALFDDGFQLADLTEVVPLVMEITEQAAGMSPAEQHQSAEAMIDYVLDNTDTWGPDVIIDPIAGTVLKALIPVLAKATKGGYKINSLAE